MVSELTKQIIAERVAQTRSQLAKLDYEIQEHETSAANLKAQRDQLAANLAQVEADIPAPEKEGE